MSPPAVCKEKQNLGAGLTRLGVLRVCWEQGGSLVRGSAPSLELPQPFKRLGKGGSFLENSVTTERGGEENKGTLSSPFRKEGRMNTTKEAILKNLCFTELVYGRINKKLGTAYSEREIELLIHRVVDETEEGFFERIGKNIYVSNRRENLKITINSRTYRVITVDRIFQG